MNSLENPKAKLAELFQLDQADTEKDNAKAANGKDRRFLLYGGKPVTAEDTELVVRFAYRTDDEGRGIVSQRDRRVPMMVPPALDRYSWCAREHFALEFSRGM